MVCWSISWSSLVRLMISGISSSLLMVRSITGRHLCRPFCLMNEQKLHQRKICQKHPFVTPLRVCRAANRSWIFWLFSSWCWGTTLLTWHIGSGMVVAVLYKGGGVSKMSPGPFSRLGVVRQVMPVLEPGLYSVTWVTWGLEFGSTDISYGDWLVSGVKSMTWLSSGPNLSGAKTNISSIHQI